MTSGFHWFVAWRYLMARPRKVSAAVLAVAGVLLLCSVGVTVVAERLAVAAQAKNQIAGWAYRNAVIGGSLLFVLGGVGVLVLLLRYVLRFPQRAGLPALGFGSLALIAVGLAAYRADGDATRAIGYVGLGAGGPGLLAAIIGAWERLGRDAEASLAFTGLMTIAGIAALVVAHYGFEPRETLSLSTPSLRLVLPAAGLLIAGIVAAIPVLIRRRLNRPIAAISLILLCGSAIYTAAAHSMAAETAPRTLLSPDELDLLARLFEGGLYAVALAEVVMVLATIYAAWWIRRAVVSHDDWELPMAVFGVLQLAGGGAWIYLEGFDGWIPLVLLGFGEVLVLVAFLRQSIVRGVNLTALRLTLMFILGGGLVMGAAMFVLVPPPIQVVVPGARGMSDYAHLVGVGLLVVGELALILTVVRYVFTFFTTVSIAGVAIGAMALVIVLSVMSGFETDLQKKILGFNAHVLISKDEGTFLEYREVAASIETVPDVVAYTPFLLSEVVVAANSNYESVIIKGIDPDTIGRVTELEENIEQDQGLQKLWPLAEDGSILGRPKAEPPPRMWLGPDTPPAQEPDAGTVLDPAPPDFDVDFDEPLDLGGGQDGASAGQVGESGGEVDEDSVGEGGDAGPADELDGLDRPIDRRVHESMTEFLNRPLDPWTGEPMDEAGGEPGDSGDGSTDDAADPWENEPIVDPAPDDFDLDFDEPVDLSASDDAGELDADMYLNPPVDIDAFSSSEDFLSSLEDLPVRRVPPDIAILPGILVGRELVKQLHLTTGQEVRVVSPLGEDTPAGPVPRTRTLRIAGWFFTGMYEYDHKYVYVPLPTLQEFLDLDDEVNGIEVRIRDLDETESALAGIRDRLRAPLSIDGVRAIRDAIAQVASSDTPWRLEPVFAAIRKHMNSVYEVKDWKEINRNLFSALKLEKIAMFLVLVIIILVASFSIVGNLIMVVVEKAKEIALLKTLGSSNSGIMRIFVTQGFFIGFVGTAIGVVHGLVVCVLAYTYGFPIDPDVYYIDRLPIHVELGAVAAVVVAGGLISVVATLYPAAIGARLRPIEGLRYE